MNSRLGCLSGSGLIATLLALLLIGGVTLARGGALFTPGALNAQVEGQVLGGVRSHAEIGRCNGCHPAFWEAKRLSDRCLACHMEVADEVRERSGLHGLLQGPGAAACQHCHTDHQGAAASLTLPVALEAYPHETIGFSLAAHRQTIEGNSFRCVDCHTESLSRLDPGVCAHCHMELDASYIQAHTAAYGDTCLACHDGLDTYGSSFDHQKAFFPLQGAHARIECTACHAGARSASDLKLTPRLCFDCHAEEDAHAGAFGQDCAGCHNPESWEEASFDHALSAFPLTGAHARVECNECHLEGPSGVVYQGTPAACAACHAEPETHAGLFEGGCGDCHTTEAWIPAGYNGPHPFPFDHGESGVSACRTCHPDSLLTYTCYGCHAHSPGEVENKHLEEGIRDFQDCTRCHPTGREEEGEGED